MGWKKEVMIDKEKTIIFSRNWLTMVNTVDFRIKGNQGNNHKGFKSQIKRQGLGGGSLSEKMFNRDKRR